MESFRLYIEFRSSLLQKIRTIESSVDCLPHRAPRSNSITRRELHKLTAQFIERSAETGFHIVRLHSSCGRRSHKRIAGQNGWVVEMTGQCAPEYKDARYVWRNIIHESMEWSSCPCTKSEEPREHLVSQVVLFSPGADTNACEIIEDIIQELYWAIEKSGNHQPRSAVREHLLWAILKLNDAILPFSLENYVLSMQEAIEKGS